MFISSIVTDHYYVDNCEKVIVKWARENKKTNLSQILDILLFILFVPLLKPWKYVEGCDKPMLNSRLFFFFSRRNEDFEDFFISLSAQQFVSFVLPGTEMSNLLLEFSEKLNPIWTVRVGCLTHSSSQRGLMESDDWSNSH